jgi:hypothetical protein
MSTRYGSNAAAVLALAAALGLSAVCNAQVSVRTIVLAGTQAPNGDPFESFNSPTMSPDGIVMFVNQGAVSLWRWTELGGFTLVARTGHAAPGTSGSFRDIRTPEMDGNGRVLFEASLSQVSSDRDTGLWFGAPGSLGLVALENNQPAGLTGPVFGQFNQLGLAVGADGTVAFKNQTRTPARQGLWTFIDGQQALLGYGGNPAPETSGVYEGFTPPTVNGSGDIVICGTGAQDAANGIWIQRGSTTSLVALAGQQAVGYPEGITYAGFYSEPKLSSDGMIAFRAGLRGMPNGTQSAAYLWHDGTTELIMRGGDQAAGAPEGYTYYTTRPVGIAAGGRVILYSAVYNQSGVQGYSGLYMKDESGIQPIFISGDTVGEGTPPLMCNEDSQSPAVAMDDQGRAVIGLVTTTGSRNAVVGYVVGRGLFPIAISDMSLEIAKGDTRTIIGASVFKSPSTFYRSTSLSDQSTVAFTASFNNGSSGVFIGTFQEFLNGAGCPSDFDFDGFVTGIDYDLYVQSFEAGGIASDFDGDGFITGIDFDLYVAAFEAGC